MTTTAAKKDHRSLPRQKHAPSLRDQAIFLAYRTQGVTQEQLAKDNGLSQRRVSQITRRVQHWLDHGIPELLTAPPGGYGQALPSSDSLDRQRLERRVARERDQAIFDRALYRHDHQPKELVTKATHDRPAGKTTSETTRQLAPSTQFLRVAIRASAELKRTEEKEPLPTPPVEMDPHQKLSLLLNLLCDYRSEAEQEHKVVKTDDHLTIVEKWLDALLGEKPSWLSDEELAPGSPLAELSNFYPHFLRSLKSSPEEDEASREGEAPAEPSDLEPETWNLQPETSSNTSNASNPSSPNSTPTPSPVSTLDLGPGTLDSPPASKTKKQKPAYSNLYERRLAHQRKLDQLAEFRRRGLPHMIHFDPADGPLPPTYHQLDSADPTNGYSIVEPGNY